MVYFVAEVTIAAHHYLRHWWTTVRTTVNRQPGITEAKMAMQHISVGVVTTFPQRQNKLGHSFYVIILIL